jgi:hypothetical protein
MLCRQKEYENKISIVTRTSRVDDPNKSWKATHNDDDDERVCSRQNHNTHNKIK